MAMTPGERRARWNEARPFLIREFRSPLFLLQMAVAVTVPLWGLAATYCLLLTLRWIPNGFHLWIGAFALAGTSLWLLGSFFVRTLAWGKEMKAARENVRIGAAGAAAELSRIRAQRFERMALWRIKTAMTLAYLIIPFGAAIGIMPMVQTPAASLAHGKTVVLSERQQLEMLLQAIRHRGLWNASSAN